jgi:hypothetical protein
MFSLSVSTVSRRNFKCGSTLSTPESCASKVSRASKIVCSYPQLVAYSVDKSADDLVQEKFLNWRAI